MYLDIAERELMKYSKLFKDVFKQQKKIDTSNKKSVDKKNKTDIVYNNKLKEG